VTTVQRELRARFKKDAPEINLLISSETIPFFCVYLVYRYFPRRAEESRMNAVRVACGKAEIQTENMPNRIK
jgi:hypothetical protein